MQIVNRCLAGCPPCRAPYTVLTVSRSLAKHLQRRGSPFVLRGEAARRTLQTASEALQSTDEATTSVAGSSSPKSIPCRHSWISHGEKAVALPIHIVTGLSRSHLEVCKHTLRRPHVLPSQNLGSFWLQGTVVDQTSSPHTAV